jgi:hypothetical protein
VHYLNGHQLQLGIILVVTYNYEILYKLSMKILLIIIACIKISKNSVSIHLYHITKSVLSESKVAFHF